MDSFDVVTASPLRPKSALPSKCRLFHILEGITRGLWKASRASGYPRLLLGGRTRTPLGTIHSPKIMKKRRCLYEKTKPCRPDQVQRS